MATVLISLLEVLGTINHVYKTGLVMKKVLRVAIRFGNKGNIWNAELGANLIGSTTVLEVAFSFIGRK